MTKDKYVFKSLVCPILECNILSDVRNEKTNKVTAHAIFQKCDDANANGHSFPRKALEDAINKIEPDIKNRHLLGELDHPNDIEDVNRIATVSLKEVSHVITDLHMDGDYVVGDFETVDTPNGLILATLLRDKLKVGVSVRAITDQDISYGLDNVDKINDFTLITYDVVHNPAYSDAYVTSIVSSCFKLADNTYKVKESPKADKLITVSKSDLVSIFESALRKNYKKR